MDDGTGADTVRPILEMDAAMIPLAGHRSRAFRMDLDVHPGDLILVQPGDEGHEHAAINVACGLAPARSGAVRFRGLDWTGMQPDHANAMRGRISHVFRRGVWVPYLTLAENMLLGQLYHTRRSYREARDEAAGLCVLFGLPGLPRGNPDDVSDHDRWRAAFVRAFLGEPDLIILESQPRNTFRDIGEALLQAVHASRERGAAVLWFMIDNRMWREPSLDVSKRLRLSGSAFRVEEPAA